MSPTWQFCVCLFFLGSLSWIHSAPVRFDCGDGHYVPNMFVCDGEDDCRNGADETICSHGRFDCGNSRFVPNSYLCDGGDDCFNGADERNCSNLRFDCGDGNSVLNVFLCNGNNECRNGADESNCSHVRFDCGNGHSVPNRFLCDGDNDCLNRADERNCSHVRFDCGNGHSVPNRFLCDGDNDCLNRADERNCSHVSFDCGDGNSVLNIFLCNGKNECRNGADESNCSHVRFDCGNGRSVPNRFLCDGDNDCLNGADERNCSHVRFYCGNGRSVPNRFLCDGDNDCLNGADERNCSNGFHGQSSLSSPSPTSTTTTTTASPEIRVPPCMRLFIFDCGNGRLVRRTEVCNGNDDCGNQADEQSCTRPVPRTRPYLNTTLHSLHRFPLSTEERINRNVSLNLKKEEEIKSPNYPQNYPNVAEIVWNVTTSPGHTIRVVFNDFRLEYTTGCIADFLKFHNGRDIFSPSLGTYCGPRGRQYEPVVPVVSSSNALIVHFKSDGSVAWRGFNLTLSTVCGGNLRAETNDNSFVSHTKFGEDVYEANVSCDWIIRTSTLRKIQITFSDFEVEKDIVITDTDDFEINNCDYSDYGDCVRYNEPQDYVEIFDGHEATSNRIGKYFGNRLPPPITSRRNKLIVRFRSGQQGNSRGFRATYKEV